MLKRWSTKGNRAGVAHEQTRFRDEERSEEKEVEENERWIGIMLMESLYGRRLMSRHVGAPAVRLHWW